MPAGFSVRGFTLFWWFGGEVRDFDADGFCQVEGGVVEVELAVGSPEVEDVSLGLAGRGEAAEDLAFEVGGELPARGGRRFVQRTRAAMLYASDRSAAHLFQHVEQWNLLAQRGIIERWS